jgi:hypothetical protein
MNNETTVSTSVYLLEAPPIPTDYRLEETPWSNLALLLDVLSWVPYSPLCFPDSLDFQDDRRCWNCNCLSPYSTICHHPGVVYEVTCKLTGAVYVYWQYTVRFQEMYERPLPGCQEDHIG